MAEEKALLLDDPRQITPAAFDRARDHGERLAVLLNYAVLAPSILNVQPWRFRIEDDTLALYIDRSRALPVTDPTGRELTISCGAALLNLRVAARAFGQDPEVDTLPDPDDADLLARVRLRAASPSEPDRRLRDAIPARRTNRSAFEDRPLPKDLVEALRAAVASEGATLTLLLEAGEARDRVAALIADAELIHLGNPAFRRELIEWAWRRIGEAQQREGEARWRLGAAGYTPEPVNQSEVARALAAAASRTLMSDEEAAIVARSRAEAAPALALLTTPEDDRRAWLAAGQALQRALLVATASGISASFLSPPVEIPHLRPQVGEAFGAAGVPQLLLRFGYGPEIAAAPRRPTEEVVA